MKTLTDQLSSAGRDRRTWRRISSASDDRRGDRRAPLASCGRARGLPALPCAGGDRGDGRLLPRARRPVRNGDGGAHGPGGVGRRRPRRRLDGRLARRLERALRGRLGVSVRRSRVRRAEARLRRRPRGARRRAALRGRRGRLRRRSPPRVRDEVERRAGPMRSRRPKAPRPRNRPEPCLPRRSPTPAPRGRRPGARPALFPAVEADAFAHRGRIRSPRGPS